MAGVLAAKGQSSGGDDQDDAVFIPYTTAQKRLMGVDYLRTISISAASADLVAPVSREVTALLRMRHGIFPGDADDFRVRTLDEMIAVRTRTTISSLPHPSSPARLPPASSLGNDAAPGPRTVSPHRPASAGRWTIVKIA